MTHSRLEMMFNDALMNRVLERCAQSETSVSNVLHAAVDAYLSAPGSVLNPWMSTLTFMQQSVLLAMVRNADGIPKHHPQKELIKWLRRCILQSAFDRCHLTEPNMPGGGSFTGPVESVQDALNEFIWARDEMTLHYFAHAMHAFEILGYHYPDEKWRKFWFEAYHRMVNALHLEPESKYEMDKRLSDNMNMWKAREDVCGGCTRTEMKDAPLEDRQQWVTSVIVENGVATETYQDGSQLSGPVGESGIVGPVGQPSTLFYVWIELDGLAYITADYDFFKSMGAPRFWVSLWAKDLESAMDEVQREKNWAFAERVPDKQAWYVWHIDEAWYATNVEEEIPQKNFLHTYRIEATSKDDAVAQVKAIVIPSSEPIPSDGSIYAEVSRRQAQRAEEHKLQDHEDALRKMAHNSVSQANVATADEAVPEWARIRDGQFVNAYTGNALGHEFDLKWGARAAEFQTFVEDAPRPFPGPVTVRGE